MAKKVVVIGGGIMGLSCAYYLQKEGHEVTVLDQAAMDAGASYVNAGYLTPSHIIPLSSPGMMAKGLKWMLNSSSPFYLKPRLDPDFLRWAWYFHKSSTPAKVARAIPVIAEINVLSKALYETMLSSGDLGDFQLVKEGLLMLFKSEKAAAGERAVMHRAMELGLEAQELDQQALHRMQPGLSPDIAGAIHYLCDAHTTPTQVMPLLQQYLRQSGVTLQPQTEVTGFHAQGTRLSAVLAGEQSFDADEVVLAAGSWSPLLARQLGLKLSLQAGKGYRIDIARPTPVRLPAILMETKVAVTPMEGFTRLAGTMELSGINHHIRENRVRAIARAAASYYEDFPVEEVEISQARCGLRPVSPDGLPYIGRSGQWENLSLATGHAMMGWSLGPITGKLISEIVSGRPTSMALDALHPDRRF
ncbi:FAD-dependent oxidoreductase [Robiginitalea sp. M366]|uniref:NAD(P)/FAD-dependent oxidoreductase n=1 Tax=Robiginitalea aestuariiviva TaxID=3036903 RepID=UPI00240D5E66|nr:FAD-dependent oxidoreductase [Robiginitalea aestuariiviva]MDG1572438.1 FAD-dependent oxidoreductase [Robiginitalea aestuariiviva]